MANLLPDDILLPHGAGSRPRQSPAAAFLPIAVALFGVAAILFGSVSARNVTTAENAPAIDTMTTGSISPAPALPAPHRPQRWE